MRRFGGTVGQLLIGTGAIHEIVGVAIHAKGLRAIGRGGVVNAVDPHPDRQHAVWFLVTGALLAMYGHLVHATERRTGTLPAAVGRQLLAVSLAGVVLMPVSGFWAILVEGALALRVAHRRAGTDQAGAAAGGR